MTILEQLRASEDPSDELMAARQAEIRALMPVPTCCTRAKKFIRLWPDGKWAARTLESVWDDDGKVQFCPCCGTKLPEVRRKAVQSPNLCVSDGNRCRCGERLPCWCDPMESAFEMVPAATAPTTAPDHLVCAICGLPAACFGSYEGDDPAYACGKCCAHGNEGGWCEPCTDPTAAARLLGRSDADTQHESRTYEDVLNIVDSEDFAPYRAYQEALAKGPGWAHGDSKS